MKVKVGLVQAKCTADVENNIQKALESVRRCAKMGANIVCLQELFASLYFCDTENYDNFSLATDVETGQITQQLQALAREENVVIIASLFEKRAAGLYHNTAIVINAGDGRLLGRYRKMHIPDDPAFYEKFYFTEGDLGYKTFKTKFGTIGVLICWDQWYPEAARITCLKGAEMLFYPTAIGWAANQDAQTNQEQFQAWQTIQRSHAIANGVHVISVNRTGIEGEGMQFWGGSFVANPFGSVLYQASHFEEETAVIELNLSLNDHYRTHWPFLRDRRIKSYGEICERFIDEK
ncbi:MAG: carbon-nitrogen hydrolase [Bacteroidales bacterium]|jgi:N-carbamoylputrescine amidase|nr:carbon-nitrogen hydrolase [Bacteroidales bacterium]